MSDWNALAIRRPSPAFTISRALALSITASVLFAVATLTLLDLGNELLYTAYWQPDDFKMYVPIAFAGIAALVFVNTRYAEFEGISKPASARPPLDLSFS